MATGYEITLSSTAIITIKINYIYHVPGMVVSDLCFISFSPKETDLYYHFHLWMRKMRHKEIK